MESSTIVKSKLSEHLPDNFVLIGYASFEQRSTTVSLSVNSNRVNKAIIFHTKGNDDQRSKNIINEQFNSHLEFIELDINNPIDIGRRMTYEIKKLLLINTALVIDITTFTHETLLMLLKLIYTNIKYFSSVTCLYNGAEEYSVDDLPEQVWLSKGCRDIRNVIGYPGLIRPSAKTCLVLLTGFELERATRLIELIEPDKLALGSGFDPLNEKHAKLMEYFNKEFIKWQESYKSIIQTSFNFSCKNIAQTVNELNKIIIENPKDNYIIVPLNTKLSTIATAIVALQSKKIQVCYSIPEIYNTKNYSRPSDNITIFPLSEIEISKIL
jgi:hypothetical protein